MTTLPQIQAGDSYTYELPTDIKITSGLTAHLAITSNTDAYDFALTDRTLTITSTDTAKITAGLYQATLYETDGTNRIRLSQSVVGVAPDYTQIQAKSKNEIRLALLEAEIQRRETGGEASYNAANVSISKIDYTALCNERDKLQEIVWAEYQRRNRKLGISPKNPIIFTA